MCVWVCAWEIVWVWAWEKVCVALREQLYICVDLLSFISFNRLYYLCHFKKIFFHIITYCVPCSCNACYCFFKHIIVGFHGIFVFTNKRYLNLKVLWDVIVKQLDLCWSEKNYYLERLFNKPCSLLIIITLCPAFCSSLDSSVELSGWWKILN